ncbi:MAG: NAD(P)/FAD-dependent oxidoreductase [Alphaproteobacteria bacterium]|nr:NAD(P)/FAD-dependent oxidoreductase [Alphaproteobacteria bacterium]MCB9698154.1 NAD(P)/FAD-dependent oxidoreductase [Alphaproteobacteria bacterium]
MSQHHSILVVGGGAAGITSAAFLRNHPDAPQIAIVEPSERHFYQPLWTLVGGGVFPREESMRRTEDFIPDGVTWIQDRVASFQPDQNQVTLASGETVTYDQLVVTPGIQLDFGRVEGLKETLGKNGVTSNYTYDTVPYTWEVLKGLKSGNAVFTFPSTPIKCAGAPQKIMWLTEHHLRKQGLRDKVNVVFASATAGIFGVPRYAKTLSRLAKERNIDQRYKLDLVAVRGDKKEAVFKHLETGEEQTISFEMLHVTPHQSAPDFIKQSPLANEAGWVDVHKHTTQHNKYPNVFSIGDASSLPNSKTAAAVRKQAPVMVENLLAFRKGLPLTASYNGYASCPLVTGYGRLILAEFGYDGVILETMPFDQSQERYSMWATKAYALPRMYWHGMLRGRW